MSTSFTPILARPRNRGWGAEGDLWYEGPNGIWLSIPHPGIVGHSLLSTLDGWETGEAGISANVRAAGFGCQFGDGKNAVTDADLRVLVHVPYSGTINQIIWRSNANCAAVVDIHRNGTSIFIGGAVKPTLAASAVDDKTDMTDITTAVVKTDQYLFILNSVADGPLRLSLTIFVEKTNA